MNTRLVNSAAGVVQAAQAKDRTAAGIALALESAGLLMSPELAAELERLRARVTELESERHSTNEALDDAVQALRAKQDEPAPMYVSRPLPPRDAVEDVTPDAITRRIAPTQALREDRYDGPLHHTYRIPRELPEMGGR